MKVKRVYCDHCLRGDGGREPVYTLIGYQFEQDDGGTYLMMDNSGRILFITMPCPVCGGAFRFTARDPRRPQPSLWP